MVKTADEWEEIGTVMPAWDYKEEKAPAVSKESEVDESKDLPL